MPEQEPNREKPLSTLASSMRMIIDERGYTLEQAAIEFSKGSPDDPLMQQGMRDAIEELRAIGYK